MRYETGTTEPKNWFTVAAVSEDGEYEDVLMGVLEVLPFGAFIRTRILDDHNRTGVVYHFKRFDEKMLLSSIIHYTYENDVAYSGVARAAVVGELEFKVEGASMKHTLDVTASLTIEVREYRDVDLSANWEATPVFGDWGAFVEYRGGLPARVM
ncbi:hypothetical protein [Clavibacter tessellarius]|uniref:Uncharacterized protein n=1 Tax=Clavibacter tessellarius TaxID=31965 RepID=A0A154UY70_9MICO|nr:hypothetical protein [Clavibacter michiganensis]KZC93894.1 hypothetical protein AWH51_00555 [Clavibacter michiganensis subsp. tessellarius]